MTGDVDRMSRPELQTEIRRLHERIGRQDTELRDLRQRVDTLERTNRRLHLELHPAASNETSHLSVIHGEGEGGTVPDAEHVCRRVQIAALPTAYDPFDSDGDVHCDGCGRDWSSSSESGGAIFSGNAVGPCCEANLETMLGDRRDSPGVLSWCPTDVTFVEFVRTYRRVGVAFDVSPQVIHLPSREAQRVDS